MSGDAHLERLPTRSSGGSKGPGKRASKLEPPPPADKFDKNANQDSIDQSVSYIESNEFSLRGFMFELLAFIIFLGAFTATSMLFKDHTKTHQLELMLKANAPDGPFENPNEFWEYIYERPAQMLRGDLTGDTPPYRTGASLYGNNLTPLGLRLRQLRVEASDCSRTASLFGVIGCFGALNLGNAEQTYVHDDGSLPQNIPNDIASAFVWQDEAGTDAIIQAGNFGLYPGSGFVIDIKTYDQLMMAVPMLENRSWVDLKTRVTFVDFDLYNANLDLWITERLISEWLPSGAVQNLFQTKALNLNRYEFTSAWDYVEFGLQCLLGIMMVWQLIQEGVQLAALGPTGYLLQFWNVLEVLNLAALGTVTVLRIKDSLKMQELRSQPLLITSPKLQNLAFWANQEDNCIGISALIMWLKLFKFARLTKHLNRIIATIQSAVRDVMGFLFIFVILLIAFSISGVLILGKEISRFSDFLGAVSSLLDALFGNYDTLLFFNANRFIGTLYLYCWLVTAHLVLLNMLVAIYTHHYGAVCRDAGVHSSIFAELSKALQKKQRDRRVRMNQVADGAEYDEVAGEEGVSMAEQLSSHEAALATFFDADADNTTLAEATGPNGQHVTIIETEEVLPRRGRRGSYAGSVAGDFERQREMEEKLDQLKVSMFKLLTAQQTMQAQLEEALSRPATAVRETSKPLSAQSFKSPSDWANAAANEGHTSRADRGSRMGVSMASGKEMVHDHEDT